MNSKERIDIRSHPENQLENIWLDDNPFYSLKRISSEVPFDLPDRYMLGMYREAIKNPKDKENTLSKLSFYCLPTLNDSVIDYRNLGTSDEDLVKEGLITVQEAVVDWVEECEMININELLLGVEDKLTKNFESKVVSIFGVEASDIDLLRTYFDSRALFYTEYQFEPSASDFDELLSIGDGIEGGVLSETSGSDEKVQQERDKFSHIHNIYSSEKVEFVEHPMERSAEDRYVQKEGERIILSSIDNLDPIQQNVIDRTIFGGESLGEIAEKNDLSVSSISIIRKKALGHIKNEMEKNGLITKESKLRKRKRKPKKEVIKDRKVGDDAENVRTTRDGRQEPKAEQKMEIPQTWGDGILNRYLYNVAGDKIGLISSDDYPSSIRLEKKWKEIISNKYQKAGKNDIPIAYKIDGKTKEVTYINYTDPQSTLSTMLEGANNYSQPLFSVSSLYQLLARDEQIMAVNIQGDHKYMVFKTSETSSEPVGVTEDEFKETINSSLGFTTLGRIGNMLGLERLATAPGSSQVRINWEIARRNNLVFYRSYSETDDFQKLLSPFRY